MVSTTPRPLYPRQRPGTHCTGGWVGPGPVWTGAENLAQTGIRSPDRPARSESLYRLSYPGPPYTIGTGSFPGMKLSRRDVDHTSPSSAEVKERVQPYLYTPLWVFTAPSRVIFMFTFLLMSKFYLPHQYGKEAVTNISVRFVLLRGQILSWMPVIMAVFYAFLPTIE